MRFVSFYRDDRAVPGYIDGGHIVVIACDSMLEYIGLPPADRAARHTDERVPLESARLAAPVRPHKNVVCVGRNYLEHAKEGARALGRELTLPEVPTFFTKAPTAIADPESILTLDPSISQQYDWEAELAVIVGTRAKNLREDEALGVVFGYSCFNDITARDLQRAHGQWFKGKSLDESAPLGPWIVTPDEIGDPQDLLIGLRIEGARKQDGHTGQMIFSIARILSDLSRGMTLDPGDVIATGTPDGVGFARTPAEYFRNGDVVEIAIQRIGTLRNYIRIV